MNLMGCDGRLATLPEILDRREQRSQQQMALLQQGPCVVSFSMNIPGALKSFPLATAGFEEGLTQLYRIFPESWHLQCIRTSAVTGEEVLLLLNADPHHVKSLTIELEEQHPLGRLWDIDVLGQDGIPLSRGSFGHTRRTCLLCGQDAKICGRSGAHTHEELFWKSAEILDKFFRTRTAETVSRCITQAMVAEVSATPKPGLVDRANNGSHRDMDFDLFLTSIRALEPFFPEFFRLGWDNWDHSDSELFAALREAGIRADKAMFAATGGVNTHKGMVFSAAILCGCLGRMHAGVFPLSLEDVCLGCAKLGRQSLSDFERTSLSPTAGLRCYRDQHVSGIRGEAAAGFPAARLALTALQEWKSQGISQNDAALFALIHLIAHVVDTNMIHRGGAVQAAHRREEALTLLPALTPHTIVPVLEELDRSYTAVNLSPGGCADLLSLAMALDFLMECGLILPSAKSSNFCK